MRLAQRFAISMLLVSTHLLAAESQAPTPEPARAVSPPAEAFALVDAMQLVETSRATLEARTRAGIAQGRKTQKELDCFKTADLSAGRAVFAEAFARSMTPAEMEEGHRFFTSQEGRKYLQYQTAQTMAARGWPTTSVPELTQDELVVAGTFIASPAGNKIYFEALESGEVKDRLFERLLPVLTKCIEKKTPEEFFAELALSMPPNRDAPSASAGQVVRASRPQAIELVRAMGEDELFLRMLRRRIAAETARAPNETATACMDRIQLADITSVMAVTIEEQLSGDEAVEATAFYRSEIGRKFMQFSFDYIERPTEETDLVGAMTVDGVLKLREFFVRPVARKLVLERITQQQPAMTRLNQRLRELVEKCRQELRRPRP